MTLSFRSLMVGGRGVAAGERRGGYGVTGWKKHPRRQRLRRSLETAIWPLGFQGCLAASCFAHSCHQCDMHPRCFPQFFSSRNHRNILLTVKCPKSACLINEGNLLCLQHGRCNQDSLLTNGGGPVAFLDNDYPEFLWCLIGSWSHLISIWNIDSAGLLNPHADKSVCVQEDNQPSDKHVYITVRKHVMFGWYLSTWGKGAMLYTVQRCLPCPTNFRPKASERHLTPSWICHTLGLAQTILVRSQSTEPKIVYSGKWQAWLTSQGARNEGLGWTFR